MRREEEHIELGGLREQVLRTMVAYYETLGYNHIRVRLPDWPTPPVIQGSIANNRPDLTCQGTDKKNTWIVLAVVLAEDLDDKDLRDRMHLFGYAALHCAEPAEMHVAVQGAKLKEGRTVERKLRDLLDKWGIKVSSIFSV